MFTFIYVHNGRVQLITLPIISCSMRNCPYFLLKRCTTWPVVAIICSKVKLNNVQVCEYHLIIVSATFGVQYFFFTTIELTSYYWFLSKPITDTFFYLIITTCYLKTFLYASLPLDHLLYICIRLNWFLLVSHFWAQDDLSCGSFYIGPKFQAS